MFLKQFKISQQEKEKLIRVKSRTGIQNWNVLCRWAFCWSIAQPSIPGGIDPLSGLCRCTESGNDDRGHADAVHHLSADHDHQQNTGGRYNTDSSAKQRADDRLRLLCGTFSAGHPGDSRSDGILPGGRFNTGADRPERICTAGTWYIIQTSGLTNVTGYHLLLNFCEKIVYNTN